MFLSPADLSREKPIRYHLVKEEFEAFYRKIMEVKPFIHNWALFTKDEKCSNLNQLLANPLLFEIHHNNLTFLPSPKSLPNKIYNFQAHQQWILTRLNPKMIDSRLQIAKQRIAQHDLPPNFSAKTFSDLQWQTFGEITCHFITHAELIATDLLLFNCPMFILQLE